MRQKLLQFITLIIIHHEDKRALDRLKLLLLFESTDHFANSSISSQTFHKSGLTMRHNTIIYS